MESSKKTALSVPGVASTFSRLVICEKIPDRFVASRWTDVLPLQLPTLPCCTHLPLGPRPCLRTPDHPPLGSLPDPPQQRRRSSDRGDSPSLPCSRGSPDLPLSTTLQLGSPDLPLLIHYPAVRGFYFNCLPVCNPAQKAHQSLLVLSTTLQ